MNLQAIKRNCMRTKTCKILDDSEGNQWISNGQAAWAVEGVQIDKRSIPELFDLSDKQLEKLLILRKDIEDPRFCRTIHVDEAEYCQDMGAVWWNGWLFRAVYHHSHGMMFLLVENLKPANVENEFSTYYALKHDDDMRVAVFNGFFCVALLRPMDKVIAEAIRKYIGDISAAELYLPIEDNAEAAADEIAGQMEMETDTEE